VTLSEWLSSTGTSAAALAERCGVHPLTIYKWKDGVNVPRQARLAALTEATGGAVTANDFHAPAGVGIAGAEAAKASTGGGLGALVREAEALGLDGEAICRKALRAAIGDAKAARWAEENRDAIEAHARYIEEHGTPLGKYRMF
jgi:antitoxin CcdA